MKKITIKSKRTLFITLLVILLTVVGSLIFYLNKKESKPDQYEKSNVVTYKESNGVNVTTSENTKKQNGNQNITTNLTPKTPTGTFISNHNPNLSGYPAPNTINSICYTTPGVNCEIRFTNSNVVKFLGPNKVGADGFVSWDWKLQDIGLYEGVWEIEVIASYGDKIASSKDNINLTVKP